MERNFRKAVKLHLAKLLEAKRLYSKKRATVRWFTFGDENSRFFQAIASMSHRKNQIGKLFLEDGSSVADHNLKAGLLYTAFKDRLGISEFPSVLYDLQSLIQRVDLPCLDHDFTKEEIDAALKDMPSDHAPGPDGFNGCFMKKCWHIIAADF